MAQYRNGSHTVFKYHFVWMVSFSSKLVHTLEPEQPIWDRSVTDKHFGYKISAYGTKDREKNILDH